MELKEIACRDHRIEQRTFKKIEQTCCNGNPNYVVHKGPVEVLFDGL